MASRPCRLLVTGFEPFGRHAQNPSADVVRRLARVPGLRDRGLATAVLPVDRQAAPRRLHELLDRLEPERVLLMGLAASRRLVTVERIAVNWWRPPGSRGGGRRIAASGPDGLFATWDLQDLLETLSEAGIEAGISESAGTYACNLVFFEALLRSRSPGRPAAVAFVHLPAATGSGPSGRAASLAALVRAARAMAESALEGPADIRRAAARR